MNEKESRFDEQPEKAPTPSPFRASNTLESLRPRDISWPTATLPGPGYAGAPADVPSELDPFQTYDPVRKPYTPPSFAPNPPANVLPVNWPASSPSPEKAWRSGPSLYDRVQKLEEQLDAVLDRLAKHNVKSSHKI